MPMLRSSVPEKVSGGASGAIQLVPGELPGTGHRGQLRVLRPGRHRLLPVLHHLLLLGRHRGGLAGLLLMVVLRDGGQGDQGESGHEGQSR